MTQTEKQYGFDLVSDDPDGDLVPFGPPVGGDDSDAELPEGYIGYATSTEHADEIIRRWNCHAELLEALRDMMIQCRRGYPSKQIDLSRARAALAKATTD